jgi:hypothetical protein
LGVETDTIVLPAQEKERDMPLDNPGILTQCSREWASRPDDQRFLDLPSMDAHFRAIQDRSHAKAVSSHRLQFRPSEADPRNGLEAVGPDGEAATMTHWSFGQVSQLAGAPAGYMRKLPAPIAADCLNYGMRYERNAEDVGVLLTQNVSDSELPSLRAATGPNYGRIWNGDITSELMRRFGDGRTGDFRIPGEFGKEVAIGKHNTTLYGSDRDMFVFLADEKNRLEVPNRRDGKSGSLARGFFVWNSEVGSKSVGVAFFLFDFVCMNRIVWGVSEYTERRIRHTISAPDRWADDITPVMLEYAASSAQPIERAIQAAQAKKLDKVDEFLANRFSARQANIFQDVHMREEGRPIETIWDATVAVTAVAREMPHNDSRVDLERAGGSLLDLAL